VSSSKHAVKKDERGGPTSAANPERPRGDCKMIDGFEFETGSLLKLASFLNVCQLLEITPSSSCS